MASKSRWFGLEEEDLLKYALDFLGLEVPFTKEELNQKYLELAKKYHPDSGHYSSSVLFLELQKSKDILENYLKKGLNIKPPEGEFKQKNQKDFAFDIYKQSKELENKAILDYYEKTKGNPVFLNEEDNPPLRELREKLQKPIEYYQKILREYPNSLWARDAEESLKRLRVWFRGRREGREN